VAKADLFERRNRVRIIALVISANSPVSRPGRPAPPPPDEQTRPE
jgi:hypothetical protein